MFRMDSQPQSSTAEADEPQKLLDWNEVEIVRIYKPTEAFSDRVAAAASLVQESIRPRYDDGPITAFDKKDLPSCQEIMHELVEDFVNTYHARVQFLVSDNCVRKAERIR